MSNGLFDKMYSECNICFDEVYIIMNCPNSRCNTIFVIIVLIKCLLMPHSAGTQMEHIMN